MAVNGRESCIADARLSSGARHRDAVPNRTFLTTWRYGGIAETTSACNWLLGVRLKRR